MELGLRAQKPASLSYALGLQALFVNMYGLGSGVMESAVAVYDHHGPEVSQTVVGGLITASGVPAFIYLCVLSIILAAATVTAWRLCLICWVRILMQHDSQAVCCSVTPVKLQYVQLAVCCASICVSTISLSSEYGQASTRWYSQ